MTRTTHEWFKEYQNKDAIWIHDGNPKRPHALLTSEKHSGGFFNSRLVIPDEALLRDAAIDLLGTFAQHGGDINIVNGVVGPKTGATKLAEFMADQIRGYTRGECFSVSPAKHEEGGNKSMVFGSDELVLLPSQNLLMCDDVLTTNGSVSLTAEATVIGGGKPLPFILVLVNRSGLTEAGGRKIVALIDRPMPMWDPKTEECPLCKMGSEAIRPKGPPEWARLNATY